MMGLIFAASAAIDVAFYAGACQMERVLVDRRPAVVGAYERGRRARLSRRQCAVLAAKMVKQRGRK